jgi:hypothetical protein
MGSDTDERGGPTNRRRFLKAVGVLGVTGFAGCGGDGDDTDEPTETTELADTTEPAETTEPMDTTEPAETTDTLTGTPVNEQPLDNPATLLEFDGDLQAQPGTTTALPATVSNPYLFDVRNVAVTLEASGDAEAEPVEGTSFDTLETQALQPAEWELTVPESASGEIDLTASVTYESATDEAEVEVTGSVVVVGPVPMPYGLNAGGTGPVEYDGLEYDYYNETDDPNPSVTLLFEDGEDPHSESGANPEGYTVEGTDMDEIYNVMMWGDDIGYEIPVTPGSYEVTLHLAEINFESEGQRVQSVSVQGETIFEELDLIAEAGFLTALTETVEVDVDGEPILIESEVILDQAEDDHSMFNAIEIREA